MLGFFRNKENVKLVVGLGNPGSAYRATRHNIGARALEAFARSRGWTFKADRSLASNLARGTFARHVTILAFPQTFMNLSGDAVARLAAKKKISLKNILIVYDDVDLVLGDMRFKTGGSAGGHNGLTSVIERLGTDAFARLRLGIGPRDTRQELAEYVLSPFAREELAGAERVVGEAAEAIGTWISEDSDRCMNIYNKKRIERGVTGA